MVASGPMTSCSSRASCPQDASRRLRGQVTVGSSARRTTRGASSGDPLPQRRRRMQQEQVHVTVLGERAQHAELARGQPREPEQRQPLGQLHGAGLGPQPGAGRLDPGRRVRHRDPLAQALPELGLPVVIRPLEVRPVQRVAIEQRGEMADGREAACGIDLQVVGQRLQPRLAQGALHDVQQRPHHAARAATGPSPGRSPRPPPPRPPSACAGTGTRRWRRSRGRPTAAASASAPSPASGPRRARARTGPRAVARAGRGARR